MELEQELEQLRARNARVEKDKAWEISRMRRGVIVLITYGAAYALLALIEVERPYLGALVPCLGYLLSTLSLPVVRGYWEK